VLQRGGVASRCGVSLPNASLPLHPISALPSAPFPESGGGVVTCLQCVSLSFSSSTPRPSRCLPGGGSGGVGEKALVVQLHAAAATPPVPPPSRAPVNLLKDSMIYPAPFNHPRPRTSSGGASSHPAGCHLRVPQAASAIRYTRRDSPRTPPLLPSSTHMQTTTTRTPATTSSR
jgi:hypothetical protein